MAMAYFILGVHEYSLQHYSLAENAWNRKLEKELLSQQQSTEIEADINVLLSNGLIGLARWSQGSEDASNYEDCLRRLEATRNADNANEINLFVSELELLKEKHG